MGSQLRMVGSMVAAAALCTGLTQSAQASPWTVPADEFVLAIDSNYQSADEEYLPDGTLQQFPLDGEFTSVNLGIGGRYGFTDRFEGAFRLNFKRVDYDSDPVVLGLPDDPNDQVAVNEAIFDFSTSEAGASDAFFYGRYNFYSGSVMLTSETSLKLPTGYQQPEGTFEEGQPTPAAIEDDVTLGDGQADLTQSLLMGLYLPPTRTFARFDVGYKHRFGSPGDQLVGGASIGQYLGDHWLVFIGGHGAYTLFEGDPIGKSFITRTPGKPTNEFSASDVETIDISLDKDYLTVEGGVILALDQLEIRASYGRMVTGSNIPQIDSFSLGVVYAIPNLTASPEASSEGG